MISRKKRVRIRHARLRCRIVGTSARPRLAVHFSGRHIYIQIIDDEIGCTLTSANTTENLFRSGAKSNTVTAIKLGSAIAERAKGLNISKVVFDRGGGSYHGKVKALAETVRGAGILF